MWNSHGYDNAFWIVGLLALVAPLGLRLNLADQTALAHDATQASSSVALSNLLEQVVPEREITTQTLLQAADIVVATIPDPDAGALGMLADEAIDAISSSAVRAGYLVDAHELPWKERGRARKQDAETSQHPAEKPAADGEASEPVERVEGEQLGALLFRRNVAAEPQWLVVFLVPESPLGGIFVPALKNALQWAGCSDPHSTLRVLAPAFSGSAKKLWRTLNACAAKARIVSGAATGELGENDLDERHAFGRTVVPDKSIMDFLLKQLSEQNRLARAGQRDTTRDPKETPPRLRVAILSETGTAYASDLSNSKFVTPPSGVRVMHYQLPLHLAELRSKQSEQHAPAAVSQLRQGLRFDLSANDGTRTDHVPVFSSLTAPSVDMAMRSLLQDIARRAVDYLVIVATDPADVYFVADKARVYAPTTQAIVLGGNLLYAHPEASNAMSGVLMVSSYPLHLEFQRGRNDHERKLFDSDASEGTFNAVQWLIADLDREHQRRLNFAPVDYKYCEDPQGGPRGWLTLINNSRLWPLKRSAVVPVPRDCARCVDTALPPPPSGTAPRESSQPSSITEPSAASAGPRGDCNSRTPQGQPSRFVRASPLGAGAGLLTLFVSLCHLALFAAARWGKHSHDVPYVRALAAPRRDRLATTQYQMVAYLSLGLFGAMTSIMMQRIYPWDWVQRNLSTGNWGRTLCGLLLTCALPAVSFALLVCALWVLVDWLRGPREEGRARWPVLLTFLPMSVLVVAAVRCGFALRSHLNPEHGDAALLLIRLSDPLGPCPLALLFCFGLGLYLWAVTGLSRTSACARFPRHAPVDIGLAIGARLSDIQHHNPRAHVRQRMRSAAVAALVCVAVLMVWVASSLRPTFEWPGYDTLVTLLFMTLSGTIAFASVQASLLWGVMREMLVEHAALPMVDAYARIAGKVMQSFGLQLRSHVPPPGELIISQRGLMLLIGIADKIRDQEFCGPEPAADGGSRSDPHPIAVAIVSSRPAIAACLAELERAYNKPVKAATERSGVRFSPAETEAIHRAFFAASDTLYAVLNTAWLKRVHSPTLSAEAERAEAWLPNGAFGALPTGVVIANAVPYSCRMWIRAAEDFVAMRVTTYVYYVMNQIRLCLGFAVVAALLLVLGVFSYPLQPQHFTSMFTGFILVGAVYSALRVIIGMQSNELLRRLTPLSTKSLNFNLFKQIATYVAVPSVVLIARFFPSLGDAFSRAVEPVMTFLR